VAGHPLSGGLATPTYIFFVFGFGFFLKYIYIYIYIYIYVCVMGHFRKKKKVKVVELPQFESLGGLSVIFETLKIKDENE
jgi:hypothetical protein